VGAVVSAPLLQILALFGAFWTAVALYARRSSSPAIFHFVGALGLGAVFAHLGWALLHLPAVAGHPSALLDPARGLTVLFVPLGLLLLERSPAAFASLPLALAVARLGCLAAGCCHGPEGEPTPLYEIGGLLVLHGLVRRLPASWVTPAVLAGFGLIRLATEPLRAIPPLGESVIPAGAIALGWVVFGWGLARRRAVPSLGPSRAGREARLLAALVASTLPAAPAGAGGAPEPPPEAVVAAIPFEADAPANRVMIDLAPEENRPWVMMLDTGASGSVITPRMARAMGVSVRRVKSSPYRKQTRLGRDLQFWVDTRRTDTASNTGWEYGLLGADFLDDYVLEIDFPARRVRFLNPKKYRIPESVDAPDEQVVPVTIGGTRPLVELELHGRPVRALLDTGAPTTILLSGRAAGKIGLDVSSLADYGEVETVLGPAPVRFHETDTVRFAGFGFDTMPVLVAPRGFYNQAGPTDSILGYDVLRQFAIRIDYRRERLWLKRTGDTRITFLGADYALGRELGAYLIEVRPGHFRVWGVAPGGLAERFGLRTDDVVVNAWGEQRLRAEEILARIQRGEELTVARLEGDVWVDHVIPDPLAEGSE
jgi:predicted aspartyl protease